MSVFFLVSLLYILLNYAKIEKKKMLERNNKGNGAKSGQRGKTNDSGNPRQKNFKSGRAPKPGGKSNGKMGFKGASKVQRKR